MNAVPVVAIIGAGQLGSRHLQSFGKTDYQLYVVDPSKESLKVAEERFKEVDGDFRGSISYYNRIDELPSKIDVCIVATNSKVRAQVTMNLLLHSRVKYLILEKVLFPALDEYDQIQQLLKTNLTKAWVNCPRRMFPIFNQIRDKVKGEKMQLQVSGNNWGLGCNGIHFLDLFAFLSGESELTLITESLDSEVHESKRAGYIEFTGTLLGFSSIGHTISITSNNVKKPSPILYSITSANAHFIIQQGQKLEIREATASNNWKWETKVEEGLFQSMLSNRFVKELLETGNCGLTPFEESSQIHKVYIKSLMDFTSKIENRKIDACLIT